MAPGGWEGGGEGAKAVPKCNQTELLSTCAYFTSLT